MSCTRKDKSPSSCTHKTRRVLESLPIKDLPQVIVDCLANSLGSNSSRCGQQVCDLDECCPGTSCTSYHQHEQWRPRPRRQLALSCTPKCTELKAAALLEELQQCREMIKTLRREANATTDLQDDCVCSNAGKMKRCKANCKKKKIAAKNCCQKKNRKKDCMKNITFDDCVCRKSETKERNEIDEANSGNQYPCKELLEKRSNDKNTSCSESSVVVDCKCEKEMIKQYKAYHKKVKHGANCNCFKKSLDKKSSNKNTCCVKPKVADVCICAKEMEKRNKANKEDAVVSAKSCQKCEKKTSDKDISCCLQPSDEDDSNYKEETSQQHKVKSERETSSDSIPCCQKLFRKKPSDNDSCCCFPLEEIDDCDCDEEMKKRCKVNFKKGHNSDNQTCCQELSRNKTSDKATCVCLPSKDDNDNNNDNDSEYDDEKISKVNFKNHNSDNDNDNEESNRKNTSDKITCSCFPSKAVPISNYNKDLKKESEKTITPTVAKAHDTSAVVSCECRVPPAFTQSSVRCKQESGNCTCDQK